MATRNTKLTVDITADDNASRVIREVQDDAERLEKVDPEIEVTVDDKASGKLGDISGSLKGLAGGAAVAGIFAAVDDAASMALSAQTLATATGDTLDNASRLQSVFGATANVDAKDLFDIIRDMNDKLRENPELVTDLGIAYDETAPAIEQFIAIVDGIESSQLSANEKVQLMAELFGDEGVYQVRQVIGVVGELGSAVDNVPGLAVVTDEDIERAREYKRQMAEVEVIYQSLATNYVDAFFSQPQIEQITPVIDTQSPQWAAARSLFGGGGQGGSEGFATGRGALSSSAAALAVTIINPPGSPTTVVDQGRTYDSRNGPQ